MHGQQNIKFNNLYAMLGTVYCLCHNLSLVWQCKIEVCACLAVCNVTYSALFQASSGKQIRTALFWVITQRVVAIYFRRSGTNCRPHHQGSGITKKLDFLPTFLDDLSVPSSRVKNPKKGWIYYGLFGRTYRVLSSGFNNKKETGFLTDVSGQIIGLIFDGQESKKSDWHLWIFDPWS